MVVLFDFLIQSSLGRSFFCPFRRRRNTEEEGKTGIVWRRSVHDGFEPQEARTSLCTYTWVRIRIVKEVGCLCGDNHDLVTTFMIAVLEMT